MEKNICHLKDCKHHTGKGCKLNRVYPCMFYDLDPEKVYIKIKQ